VLEAKMVVSYNELSTVYLGTGALSILGAGTLIFTQLNTPRMKKDYASRMIFIITVMDLLLTLKFFVSALLWRLGQRSLDSSFHVFDDNWCVRMSVFPVRHCGSQLTFPPIFF